MNINELLLIVIFFIILFFLIVNNKKTTSYFSKLEIKKSPVAGLGIFAKKNFKVGEIIEIAPIIKEKRENIGGLVEDYLFSVPDEGMTGIALGWASLYNHSDDNNASWRVDGDYIIVTCIKDIKKGEEIFVSYGTDYWNSRNILKK
jgi:SET domain-containing protein